MGRRFLRASSFDVKASDEDIRDAFAELIHSGRIFVAERDEVIVGMLGARLVNPWFSRSVVIATELMWWVDEEHRGSLSSVRLVGAFEQWAKSEHADMISMSDLTGYKGVDRLLSRLGYKCVERAHIKGVA